MPDILRTQDFGDARIRVELKRYKWDGDVHYEVLCWRVNHKGSICNATEEINERDLAEAVFDSWVEDATVEVAQRALGLEIG